MVMIEKNTIDRTCKKCGQQAVIKFTIAYCLKSDSSIMFEHVWKEDPLSSEVFGIHALKLTCPCGWFWWHSCLDLESDAS